MKLYLHIALSFVALSAFAAEPPDPLLKVEFNTTCAWCTNEAKLVPLKSVANLVNSVNGGVNRSVTLTFQCGEVVKCGKCKNCKQGKLCRKPKPCNQFTQQAVVFVENRPLATPVGVIAVPAPAELPPVPSRSITRPPPPLTVVLPTLTIELVSNASFDTVTWTPIGTDGSGSASLAAYNGPAVRLRASGLAVSEGLFIESSQDLYEWLAYPSVSPQLTLIQTNPACLIPVDIQEIFFRGRLGTVNL